MTMVWAPGLDWVQGPERARIKFNPGRMGRFDHQRTPIRAIAEATSGKLTGERRKSQKEREEVEGKKQDSVPR